jgi:hypothetical protein
MSGPKQSHYRPGQVHRVPGGWGSQISRQSAHEGNTVVSPTHRPPLPPGKYPWYSFLLEAVNPRAIVRTEGLCQLKFPMTPSGIQPATFRFVAQYPKLQPYAAQYSRRPQIAFVPRRKPQITRPASISLYSINWMYFITQTENVCCAVRAESLKEIQVKYLCLKD